MKKLTKKELAEWYVSAHSDCGHVLYFSGDPRSAVTEDYFFKHLMKKRRGELVELIYNHSDEGRAFLNK